MERSKKGPSTFVASVCVFTWRQYHLTGVIGGNGSELENEVVHCGYSRLAVGDGMDARVFVLFIFLSVTISVW